MDVAMVLARASVVTYTAGQAVEASTECDGMRMFSDAAALLEDQLELPDDGPIL